VGKIEDDVYEGLVRATCNQLSRVTVEGQLWVHVPAGSVLMPKALTADMRDAAGRASCVTHGQSVTRGHGHYETVDLDAIYRAMVGARPTIPT